MKEESATEGGVRAFRRYYGHAASTASAGDFAGRIGKARDTRGMGEAIYARKVLRGRTYPVDGRENETQNGGGVRSMLLMGAIDGWFGWKRKVKRRILEGWGRRASDLFEVGDGGAVPLQRENGPGGGWGPDWDAAPAKRYPRIGLEREVTDSEEEIISVRC